MAYTGTPQEFTNALSVIFQRAKAEYVLVGLAVYVLLHPVIRFLNEGLYVHIDRRPNS
jgi:hypothetical protein